MSEKPADNHGTATSASAAAYHIIQNAIITRQLAAGSLLTEQELTQLTGVSRTPIREAINRLANDGWMRIKSGKKNKKIYVAEFSRDDLIELCELRAEIESFTALRAAKLINEAELDRLEEIQEEIDAAIRENSSTLMQTFERLNEEFHSIIWNAGSVWAARVLSGILSAPVQAARPPQGEETAHLRRASTYHRSIIAALRRRDGPGAAVQMSAHIHSIVDRL